MSPKIATQLRGLERQLGIQDPLDRINFVGSDVSPTINIDPGTLRADEYVEEFSTITGPVTVHNFLEPPVGFFKLYLLTSLSQNDPAGREARIRVESIATGRFLIIQENPNLVPGFAIPNGRQILIPRGFRLGAQVIALGAGFPSNLISMALTLPVGGAPPPGP